MNIQQLCAIEIDGTTNAINTNILAYTCPSGKQIVISSANMSSENSSNGLVWLWNAKSGYSVGNANRLIAGELIASTCGRINIQIGMCLQAGDTIYFKSSVTNVNLIIYGDIYDL